MRRLPVLIAFLALAACSREAAPGERANPAAAEQPAGTGLDRSQRGKPAPDVAFKNPQGEDITLAEFEGKPVLVNLWATWCAPCVKELPTLDALARTADGRGLQVIAVSQDVGPHPSVVAFLDKHRIDDLGAFQDPAMRLSGAVGAQILPTSILYDADGNEVWRYVGDLDWSGAKAATLLAEVAAPAR